MKKIILLTSHLVVGMIGFAAGIYALPILTAPSSPTSAEVSLMSSAATYKTNFIKDLTDSDFLHQAEGVVTVSQDGITFDGSMSPGPDYILYLSPEFVETEVDFERLKNQMTAVGSVKTFDKFIVDVPAEINIENFNTVIVWCESFGEFITSAQYK